MTIQNSLLGSSTLFTVHAKHWGLLETFISTLDIIQIYEIGIYLSSMLARGYIMSQIEDDSVIW